MIFKGLLIVDFMYFLDVFVCFYCLLRVSSNDDVRELPSDTWLFMNTEGPKRPCKGVLELSV